jgi:hypothetical protein
MTAGVVAIDPNYEDLTIAAYTYRQANVYRLLQTAKLSLNQLVGAQADIDPVNSASLKDGVVYITGVGHGTYDSFSGYYNHPVFSVADLNPAIVAGKIVHLLSCNTATGLGPDMVALGCRAFFGYCVPFTFDPTCADLFFECDAQIDIGLATGLPAGQVAAQVKASFQKAIDNNPSAAGYLQMNLDNFRSPINGTRWGDVNARLFNA